MTPTLHGVPDPVHRCGPERPVLQLHPLPGLPGHHLSGYTTSPPCAAGQTPCFNGGANITRGQVAKIVANAAGFNDAIPSTQQTFSDVPFSNPFWVYIERAAAHSVISGYTTSPPCPAGQVPCFLPANNVTRGQMAKIDAQAAGYSDAIPSTQQTFTDVPDSNPFWVYHRAGGAARGDQRLLDQPAVRAGRRALLPAGQQPDPQPGGQDRRQRLLPQLPDACCRR